MLTQNGYHVAKVTIKSFSSLKDKLLIGVFEILLDSVVEGLWAKLG